MFAVLAASSSSSSEVSDIPSAMASPRGSDDSSLEQIDVRCRVRNTFIEVNEVQAEASSGRAEGDQRPSSCPPFRHSVRADGVQRNWSLLDAPAQFVPDPVVPAQPDFASEEERAVEFEHPLPLAMTEAPSPSDDANERGAEPPSLGGTWEHEAPATPRGNASGADLSSLYSPAAKTASPATENEWANAQTPCRTNRVANDDATPPQPYRPRDVAHQPTDVPADAAYAALAAASPWVWNWMTAEEVNAIPAFVPFPAFQETPSAPPKQDTGDNRKVELNLSVWLPAGRGSNRRSHGGRAALGEGESAASAGAGSSSLRCEEPGAQGLSPSPAAANLRDRRSKRGRGRAPLRAGRDRPVTVTLCGLANGATASEVEALIWKHAAAQLKEVPKYSWPPASSIPFEVQLMVTEHGMCAEVELPVGPKGAVIARQLKRQLHNAVVDGRQMMLLLPGESHA